MYIVIYRMSTKDIIVVRKGLVDKKKFQSKTNLYEISFETKNGKSLSRQQINKISNAYLKKIRSTGNNYRVQVSIKYDDLPLFRQWKYGHTTTTYSKDKIQAHDPIISESDINKEEVQQLNANNFHNFKIFFWEISKAGGCSDNTNNDCLFLALDMSNIKLPSCINSATKLKKHFKLGRKDRFPIDKLDELAELIEHQIILIGDEKQVFGNFDKSIRIKLHDNHYTLQASRNIKKIEYYNYKPKSNVIVYDSEYNTYPYVENSKTFINHLVYHPESSEYALVLADDKNKKLLNVPKEATLETIYNKFIMVADNLKQVSNNKINLYVCGTNIRPYILDLFNKSLKITYKTDDIDCVESDFLSAGGGILICPKEYEGYAYEYDMNCAYQSSMINNVFKIPLCKPEYEIFDASKYIGRDNKPYFPYGLYKAKVYESNNKEIDTYFTFRDNNKYTHIDLTFAKELGLKIEHIKNNNECNCALYNDKSRFVVGKTLFENYINDIVSLLKNPDLLIESKNYLKQFRNLLHGLLSKKNKIVALPENGITKFEFEDNDIDGITTHNEDGSIKVVYTPQTQPFKYNYARLLPFLTSSVRCRMGKIIKSNVKYDDLLRSHTDSFFVKTPINTLDIGDDIGQFKLKKEGQINIKNKLIYDWV